MKSILLPALLLAATLANATGGFSLIEMNPLHGTEEYTWSDSSKHVYGAGELSNFTELNGHLYYLGQDTAGNEELWTSDGTQQGTKMVKDINPDGPSQMGNIMTIGNKMIFVAADNNNWDFDLFASDGTEGGTVKIADISQSWNDILSTQRAAVFGNKVLFCTSTELISTDGTSAGTKTILALSQYNPAQGYCELNGNAYFILTDNMGKPQLWMTDGTTSGTRMAYDLAGSPTHITFVEKLLTFNGKLYMSASASGLGSDLYTFDGANLQHIELVSGANAYPTALNVVNNQLFFTASNLTHTNLYRMTTADAIPQVIAAAATIDVNGPLSFCNNSVYFLGMDNNQQIHRVDLNTLTLSSLNLSGYTIPNYWFSDGGSFLTGTGGKIFFAAYDTLTGNQVFMESDGTDAGTFSVMPPNANTTHPFNIIIGCGSADVFDFKMWGNKVIVPANFTNAGRELWFYEPQSLVSGIQSIAKQELQVQLYPNPTSRQLFVRLQTNGYCDNTQLKVTALNGQLMLQDSFAGNTGSLDVSGLATGNYCLTITGTNNSAINRHFVVGK